MQHTHTNKLITESSPYLLQHAHNPVNWYPWGEEALQKAKTENKIILVSIGYAACHWCHVMERESFENETTASLMNRHFINIKIDREERPDLDHIYMDAVQAMTGSGGWPLNVFLTPDAKPFYGGTYFPPVRAHNRPSWTEVMGAIAAAWDQRSHELLSQAENLLAHMKQSSRFAANQELAGGPAKHQCAQITEAILKQADTVWGGFGKAPKFPQTFTIQYLLQHYHYTRHEPALQQALLSLNKMINGGIYDQVGGGFARYSTDAEWLAPHFEKMLYDNALLINVLCDAWQITRLPKYENTIRQTIAFLQREMQHEAGGFFAALDADSEGEEGKFYVWNHDEIKAILQEDAALFCDYFDISEKGNWEGTNILRILKEPAVFAAEKQMEEDVVQAHLNRALDKLLSHRSGRIRPATDDKILLGWNALLVTALCKAAAAFNDAAYSKLAIDTMRFLLAAFRKDCTAAEYYHTYKNNIARYPAFLDDYAYLIQACIHLQEITSDNAWLETAKDTLVHVLENFYDAGEGFFMFTGSRQTDVIMRKKEIYDGATPSGNSVMAVNLAYLAVVFNNAAWRQIADKMLATLTEAVVKYPTSFGVWASLLQQQAFGVQELVIVGPGFTELRQQLLQAHIPGKILQCAALPDDQYPLLAGKNSGEKNHIYWCRQYECQAPFLTVEKLMNELEIWNYSTSKPQ